MTQHEQIRDLLIGAWELVSWQSIGPDATVDYTLGENAVGQLMYDGASNRVSAQLRRQGCGHGHSRDSVRLVPQPG
jgi:Lipocalin-like domain